MERVNQVVQFVSCLIPYIAVILIVIGIIVVILGGIIFIGAACNFVLGGPISLMGSLPAHIAGRVATFTVVAMKS